MKTAARMLNSSGASLWHIDGLDESHDDETDESGDCQLVTKNVRVTKEEIVFQKQFSEVNSARSNRNFEKHTRARKEQTRKDSQRPPLQSLQRDHNATMMRQTTCHMLTFFSRMILFVPFFFFFILAYSFRRGISSV